MSRLRKARAFDLLGRSFDRPGRSNSKGRLLAPGPSSLIPTLLSRAAPTRHPGIDRSGPPVRHPAAARIRPGRGAICCNSAYERLEGVRAKMWVVGIEMTGNGFWRAILGVRRASTSP